GALATAGYGTALAIVRAAVEAGKRIQVISCETRPFLQGARLTAWELKKDRIPVTLITDNMAGHLMQRGRVSCVIVGTDRTAANGDVANKIGTYPLAVLAHPPAARSGRRGQARTKGRGTAGAGAPALTLPAAHARQPRAPGRLLERFARRQAQYPRHLRHDLRAAISHHTRPPAARRPLRGRGAGGRQQPAGRGAVPDAG